MTASAEAQRDSCDTRSARRASHIATSGTSGYTDDRRRARRDATRWETTYQTWKERAGAAKVTFLEETVALEAGARATLTLEAARAKDIVKRTESNVKNDLRVCG